MSNVFYHTMRVMFFLHGFALLLVLDPMIVLGSPKIIITQPKDKEIFVGDKVVFDWDHREEEKLESLRFGIVRNGSEGSQDITLLLKRPNGIIYQNTKEPVFKELIKRIELINGKRASFSISNVRMNDTGYYFCAMKIINVFKTFVDYVRLKVVDLQIDEKASSSVEESWKKQKIHLVCMVRVVKDEPVTFTWLRQPNNQTLSRGKHNDSRTESFLTIITSSDADFTTYTCVAKTKRTTKMHNVVVKRLYGPGPPQNLQQQYVFDKHKGEAYHKVYWIPPRINGGAKVTDYIIEYKPRGIDWGKATRAITKDTRYTGFNLKEGKLYDVRVLARNKVDEGSYSNVVEIKISGRPLIISPLTNKTITKGSPIYLVCNASGDPTPNITWSKTGGAINPLHVSGNVLEIPRAELSDAGQYVCTARNGFGGKVFVKSVEVFVTVKLRPHSPVPLSTQITHMTIKVHWKAPESHGFPVLMYSIHKVELDDAGREVTSRTYHVNEDVHDYEVGDLEGGKSYKFYVTAWNTHGESVKDRSKSISIKLQKP